MKKLVDTNVPIAANGLSEQVDATCVLACIHQLEQIKAFGICLDSGFRILDEYMKNLSMSGQPGAGDFFMKWVWNVQADESICQQTEITDNPARGFDEFPDDPRLTTFDRSDRKFVAVARAAQPSPPIVNAVDSDWHAVSAILAEHKVVVEEICSGTSAVNRAAPTESTPRHSKQRRRKA